MQCSDTNDKAEQPPCMMVLIHAVNAQPSLQLCHVTDANSHLCFLVESIDATVLSQVAVHYQAL